MRRIECGALDRTVSALALGTMHFREDQMDWVRQMLDAWTDAGGNVLDCAQNYGDGGAERAVGRWLQAQPSRSDIALLTKGGHPDASGSRLAPAAIAEDFEQSLECLRTDYADIYLLHRDDESVPVGEIVDALDEYYRAGRARSVGVSNWRPERIDAANAYAAANGRAPLTVSSPHLSLARQVTPPWPGCVSAADAESRRYYAHRDLTVIPWSSQAGGFFANGDKLPDRIAKVYGTPENHERLRRAQHLAAELHSSANHVALAWVLGQPFCVLPVVGPMTPAEINDSTRALDIHLTEAQLAWLDLAGDDD